MNRTCRLLSSLPKEEFSKFLGSIDTVLTDCDGVLWLGNEVLQDANTALNKLQEMGKKVFYVTNNSTQTREEYASKCAKLNFKATKDEIISTSYLAASYLQDKNFSKKVYVVGSKGVTQELDLVGIKHTGLETHEPVTMPVIEYVRKIKLDPEIGAVVVGFDPLINYAKMLHAASYLSDPNCLFVATNTDERFPLNSSLVLPGTGSMVAAVQTCAGRLPFIVGKPESYIKDAIVKKHNIDPKKTLMIGDRCNTDILLGTRCGFSTLLVLTGVTKLNEVRELEKSSTSEDQALVPDFYLDKLGDLLPLL